MKLQRSVTRRLGDKEYVKHQLVIPSSAVAQLRWSPRDFLGWRITAKGLLVYKVEARDVIKKLQYEQFKDAVTSILTEHRQGCTWSELRLKAGLSLSTPSPIWVKRMEDENTLKRIRDPTTARVIWKLPLQRSTPRVPSTLNGWTERNPGSD